VEGPTGIFRTRKCLKNGRAHRPWMAESPKNYASAEFFNNLLEGRCHESTDDPPTLARGSHALEAGVLSA
jgi:hypothetical protein